MPLGGRRTWNHPPQFGSTDQQDWATWVQNSITDMQGPVIAPAPPQVTTISHPGAILIAWNEINQATAYAVYETDTPTAAPGVPFAVVPTNMAAISNAVLRPNLNDTTTRYYSVVTITQFGRSVPSTPVAGAALATSSAVTSISQNPLNQEGVGGGIGGGGGIWGQKPGSLF